jgi:hypothetical protein
MKIRKILLLLLALLFSIPSFSKSLPASDNPEKPAIQSAEAWNQIRINMKTEEVEAILGKPLKKKRMRGFDQILYEWEYPGKGYIRFYMDKVRSIFKPKNL